VIATKGPAVRKPVEQYDMLRTFAEFISWRKGSAIVLAEANVTPDTDMKYFGDAGERLQMMFNFQVNQHLFYALATADTHPLIHSLRATEPRSATAQWGQFLRNHDELDLGRLTPQQRQACFAGFAPEKNMQLYNRGIRRRLAPMLHGDRRRLEMAYSLMLSLPGRNACRTPMQWSRDPQGGFTTNSHPKNPVITGGTYGYEQINVADQRRDPNSFMNWM